VRRAIEWCVLGGVIVASLWLWPTPGSPDVGFWTDWTASMLHLGLRDGYIAIAHDYPPGCATLLWMAGRIGEAFGANIQTGLKILVTTFLLATTTVVLAWTRRPLVAAFAYASLAVGAIGLVYLDILPATLLIGAAWALSRDRRGLALVLLAVACTIKWQPVMTLPFVLCYACMSRPSGTTMGRAMVRFAVVPAGVGLVLLAAFGPVVLSAFSRSMGHHHVSAQAANAGWILTWILHVANPAVFGPIEMGRSNIIVPRGSVIVPLLKAIFGVLFISLLVRYARSGDRSVVGLLRHALAGYLVYFMFNGGVHENHLQMAVIFAIALAAVDLRWIWAAAAVAICANANMIAFYGVDGPFRYHVFLGVDASVWLAVVVMATLAAVVLRLMATSSRT
jgi:hypothetical protein